MSQYAHLLTGMEALAKPNFHELNQHSGRNDRLLHAVLCAYAKHCICTDDIGWNELGETLHSVICNEIGHENYCRWVALMVPDIMT